MLDGVVFRVAARAARVNGGVQSRQVRAEERRVSDSDLVEVDTGLSGEVRVLKEFSAIGAGSVVFSMWVVAVELLHGGYDVAFESSFG